MEKLCDDRLIEEYKNGNQEAMGILYDRHSGALYGYLLRIMGNTDEASDLMQDTFCRFIEKVNRYKSQDQFKAFLFRIAHNLAVDSLRRRRFILNDKSENDQAEHREKMLTEQEKKNSGSSDNPADKVEEKEVLERLGAAIVDLPEDQKQVLLMKHYTGMTFREIADIIGIPLNTALGRMHYAIRNLRKQLDDLLQCGRS